MTESKAEGMRVTRGDELPAAGGEPARACARCSAPLELLTVLPPAVDHSGYRIFRCAACGFVEWLAQQR